MVNLFTFDSTVTVLKCRKELATNVGALRRRVPEPVSPWRQLNKDTKAGHLYCRSSVIRQPGVELDLKSSS